MFVKLSGFCMHRVNFVKMKPLFDSTSYFPLQEAELIDQITDEIICTK